MSEPILAKCSGVARINGVPLKVQRGQYVDVHVPIDDGSAVVTHISDSGQVRVAFPSGETEDHTILCESVKFVPQ